MKSLLAMCGIIDAVNERLGRIATWLVLLSCLVSAGNAFVRYGINMSSNAWLEIQWYLNSAMFLLVAAYTLKLNAHVRIDVIAGKLSPRTQAWIDVFGSVVMLLPAVLIIAWYSLPSLASSLQLHEMSSDSGGLVRWPVRLLIPLSFGLLALQGVSEIIKRAAFLQGLIASPAEHKQEAI